MLSGAGISTESGIPDYRSPERLRRPRRPITFQQFTRSEEQRRRYWARSAIGWQAMAGAIPNDGHAALATMESSGAIEGIVTQNVDGLHQKAGSRKVLELHGSLESVLCLECRRITPRSEMQELLLELNPQLDASAVEIAPDGDADLPERAIESVRVPVCTSCGGVLKPNVVFFGENVPKERVERCARAVEDAEVLLVVGSSLAVMSGMRWVLAAVRAGKPVAIVNDGPTRGDELATLKVAGRLGEALPRLAHELEAGAAAA
ncbi:MAG TPA: NAD-dependent protein deacetylase [Trueperaceae bacterium]